MRKEKFILMLFIVLIMVTMLSGCFLFKVSNDRKASMGIIQGRVDVYIGKSPFISSQKEKTSKFAVSLEKSNGIKNWISDEIVVGLKNQKTPSAVFAKNAIPFSYEIKDELNTPNRSLNAVLLKVSTNVSKAIEFFEKMPNVKYVEPNYTVHALSPNDPYYSSQWNLPDISVPQAWKVTKGSNTVIVAVLDTGVSSTHPDLQNVLVPGYNFVSNSTDTDDDYGHGTHVAGIIDADTDNTKGIAGIDWGEKNSVKIMPIKILDSSGIGNTMDIAKGIVYAVEHGAKIINMSFGGKNYSRVEEEACQYARNNGITLIAAAGNEDLNSLDYPAAFPAVIAVSAVGPNNTRAYYSNYANNVIWAPGGDIDFGKSGEIISTYYSTSTHKNTYAYLQGTSMAAPHVAAVVALMVSNGITNSSDILNILKKTAKAIPASSNYGGYGLVSAYNAVTYNDGWEPLIIWAEDSNGSVATTTFMQNDGSFDLKLSPGTYKIYAWQDFNKNDFIDAGDFYGYLGYHGSADNSVESVSVTSGKTVKIHLYVSPKINESNIPSILSKLVKYKKQVTKEHYANLLK